MFEVKSGSEKMTRSIARDCIEALYEGIVIGLDGELGAGKTVFTKALAQSLGIKDMVNSPTYTLVKSYDGFGFRVNHFDLYRISSEQELLDIGFYDYFGKDINIIEWASKAKDLPKDTLRIEIKRGEKETDRILVFSCDNPDIEKRFKEAIEYEDTSN